MDSEDRSLALRIVRSDGFHLIPNSCRMQCHENSKLSTRDSEECKGHEKLQVFTLAANPRLVFSRFWSSFIGIEVSNEEEYSILRILYRYSLQQLIFLAFCNDFGTHYRVLAYILLRNTTLLFPR